MKDDLNQTEFGVSTQDKTLGGRDMVDDAEIIPVVES